jgi:hypothetical protein
MHLTIASCSYRIPFIFAVMHRHLKISMEVREDVQYVSRTGTGSGTYHLATR